MDPQHTATVVNLAEVIPMTMGQSIGPSKSRTGGGRVTATNTITFTHTTAFLVQATALRQTSEICRKV
jgi:hypothetical protein